MVWNPNTPASLGLEWTPTTPSAVGLASDAVGYSVVFTAGTTRTITAIDFLASAYINAGVQIELYTEADWLATATDTVTVASAIPSLEVSDPWVTAYGIWDSPASPPRQAGLQDDPYPASTGDATYVYLHSGGGAIGTWMRLRFATLAIPAGRRPLNLRLATKLWFPRQWAGDSGAPAGPQVVGQLRHFYNAPTTGNQYTIGYHLGGTSFPDSYTTYTVANELLFNPDTNKPWTIADIAAWATGGSGGPEVVANGNSIVLFSVRAYSDHVVERRLAWATAQGPIYNGYHGRVQSGTLATPSGATSVTLTAGNRYVILLRRVPFDLPGQWRGMTNANYGIPVMKPIPPHVGTMAYEEMLTPYGLMDGRLGGRTPLNGTLPIITLVSGTPDIDLNPYHVVRALPIHSTLTARQRFTGAAATYSVVRAQVIGGPVGTSLTFKVRRQSDNVQMGSTCTITRAEWDALPSTPASGAVYAEHGVPTNPLPRLAKLVTLNMATPVVLAAVDYYLDVESASTDTTEATGWEIVALWGEAVHAGGGYKGSGSGALTYGATIYTEMDMTAQVQTPPTAPASPTATMTGVALHAADGSDPPGSGTTANDGIWNTAQLGWAATSLGVNFGRYEVQRYDPADLTPAWQTIGTIATEATVAFTDYEGRRGVASQYRVRVVRADGATSLWATLGTVTPLARTCGIGLVVNGASFLRAVYQDVEPLREWTVLDVTEYRQRYRADYQVAFRSAEQRGVSLQAQLLVYSGGLTAQQGGLPRFDLLRSIARQVAPYVAVIDDQGSRIYASLEVGAVREQVQGHVHYALVRATQLLDVPVVLVA